LENARFPVLKVWRANAKMDISWDIYPDYYKSDATRPYN
jgi:hypothetical protein